MYVSDSGVPGEVPIVFLHGSMVSGWMWTDQVADLSDYRCLVPDLPGFDRSASETWVSFKATADTVAEMIRNQCGDGGAHVVGLSLGGIVGLHLAVRHPETVRSLLVSGVPHGSLPASLRILGVALTWLYPRAWGARLVARALGIPRGEAVAAFVATAGRTDPEALRSIRRDVENIRLPSEARVPTLAVVGERDTKSAHRAVSYLSHTMPTCTGRVVPAVGHQWNAENRRLFSDMVRQWVASGSADDRLWPVDASPGSHRDGNQGR